MIKNINRRQFIENVAVVAILPILPLPAMASIEKVTAASGMTNPNLAILDNAVRFNGVSADKMLQIQHLGNGYRAYNPLLMRFHSQDSMTPFGDGGINSYGYVNGDPFNNIDPSGHAPIESGALIFGLEQPRIKFCRANSIWMNRIATPTIDSLPITPGERRDMILFPDDYPKKTPRVLGGEFYRRASSFQEFVKLHDRYNSAYYKFIYNEVGDVSDNKKSFSRKCKAGLEWAISNELGVHFVLDGIDYNRIIHERNSYTSSELRWIYRNAGNHKVANGITFWLGGQQVPPPWATPEGRGTWSAYRPKGKARLSSISE